MNGFIRYLVERVSGYLGRSGLQGTKPMRIFIWIATTVALSVLTVLASAHGPALDTVEDLREALKQAVDNPSERQHRLASAVLAVTELADVQRAIALLEWRDEDPDPAIAAVDNQSRRALAQKYEKLLRDHLGGADAEERSVALTHLRTRPAACQRLLVEIGATERLGHDLEPLIAHGEPAIQREAIAAIVQMHVSPALVANSLRGGLTAADWTVRKAAIEALNDYLRTIREAPMPSHSVSARAAPHKLVVDAAIQMLPVAAQAAQAPQRGMHARGIEALERGTGLFVELLTDSRLQSSETPAADERQTFLQLCDDLRPLLECLRSHSALLVQALEDRQAAVRLTARRAWEDLAAGRQQIQLQAAQLRIQPAGGAAVTEGLAPLLAVEELLSDMLRQGVPAIAAGISDADPQARSRAIDVLETLGPAAQPAMPVLIKALADSDRFVRWSAVRTIGRLAPAESTPAVEALARCLADSDLDVQQAAARALESYGPAAASAVPALARALDTHSTTLKLAILRSLKAIGPPAAAAQAALKPLASDADEHVRRAARELSEKFHGGPEAMPTPPR
jgi:hypothetical protein